MYAMLVGLGVGIGAGLLYLFSTESAVRRTLSRSVLLGVFVGVLVELARRPLLGAVFAGVATIFLLEFLRWVVGRSRNHS